MRTLLPVLALLGGCALLQPEPKEAPLKPGEVRSAQAARDAIAIGDTKDAVRAALGQGTEVDFASGYGVWVYRQPEPVAELVLLFDPSGTLAKTRVR